MSDDSTVELNISFHDDVSNWQLDNIQEFITWLRAECSTEKMNGIFQVIFVNSDFITALNKTYFNKEHPTDVIALTFRRMKRFCIYCNTGCSGGSA